MLIIISFVDLFLYTGALNTPTTKETFYPKTAGTNYLKANLDNNERILSVGRSFIPSTQLAYGIRSVQAHGLTSKNYKNLMQKIDPIYLSKHGTAGYIKPSLDLTSPLLDLFNVKYIVTDGEINPKYQCLISIKHYNSNIDLEYNRIVEQTFEIDKEEKIEIISIKTAGYSISQPVRVEAAILEGTQTIARQDFIIENNKRSGLWQNIYFDPAVHVSPGKKYHIKLSIDRPLSTGEYFKLNCVNRDMFRSGVLLNSTCKDLAFKVLRRSIPEVNDRYQLANSKSFKLYENMSLNRKGIFSIKKIQFIDNKEDYLSQTYSEDFFSTAFLKKEDQQFFKQTTFQKNDDDNFNYLQYEDSYIKIKAKARHDGFIKIPDSFYPGWEAFIDGKKTKIFKTDLIFRGIKIPSGEHIIEFRYFPRSLLCGGIISVFTLFSIITYEIFIGRKQIKKLL